MDGALLKLWIIAVLTATSESSNKTTLKCERLSDAKCYDLVLPYNYTTFRMRKDSNDHDEIQKNLQKWEELKIRPPCWKALEPLICRFFIPECFEMKESNYSIRLPCRSSCIAIRKLCTFVEEFRNDWPDFLKCERFPLFECENLTSCPIPLVFTDDSNSWFEDKQGCGIQCENPMFDEEEHGRIRRFIGAFGTLSLLCTTFTVFTYLVGWKTQNKYPSVILFYINACFCLMYVGFMVQFFGESRKKILCRYDNTMRLGEPVGADSALCILTFILVFYFSIAGIIWFVILTYAWCICFQCLGTTRDNLTQKAVCFHMIAWIPPLILTCVVIGLAEVDSNSLTGICFVGYRNMNMRIYFFLLPLGLNIVISAVFLSRGLKTLCKLRRTNPHLLSQRSTSRIKETIIRIGLFALLAFVFVSTTFACHLYDYFSHMTWDRARRNYIKCIVETSVGKSSAICHTEDKQDLSIIEFHLFSLFGAGITMSAWTWTSSTLSSWKNAWNRLTGKRRYPELSHYNLIRRMREMRKMQAAVHPSSEIAKDKNSGKIRTPPAVNEESLQIQSIVSDISVIADPKLLLPARKEIKRVRIETDKMDKCEEHTETDKMDKCEEHTE